MSHSPSEAYRVRSFRGSEERAVPAAAEQTPDARNRITVIYVHGIGNKPPASVLKCQWDYALFGADIGDRSRMAYWVNREYYPEPLAETCRSRESIGAPVPEPVGMHAESQPIAEALEVEIESLTQDKRQADVLRAIARRIDRDEEEAAAETEAAPQAEFLPLPRVVRRWSTRLFTRTLLRDVNDFLFHPTRRARMEQSVTQRLTASHTPYIVIGHSQGSMVAYEVLRKLDAAQFRVPLFLTIGSPLGIQEVQDELRQWQGGTLRKPACVARWVNVADRLDPVAADPKLANDFEPGGFIEDKVELFLNPDSPRHPHSGTGYLSTEYVQAPVREVAGLTLAQPISDFVIARDLVESLEDEQTQVRMPVLIQLKARDSEDNLTDARHAMARELEALVGPAVAAAEIEPLKRFLAARLTRTEIESLAARHADLQINRIWKDSEKNALLYQSIHTIQSNPARKSYGAEGDRITWAVLDSGIRGTHPHFATHDTIIQQWDCTQPGPPSPGADDENGHGTHVAAIIAGRYPNPLPLAEGDAEAKEIVGIAPLAKIYGYKVLADNGRGRDSWIIKALDHIADLNESSASLVIHGVNLSLGGPFDRTVYGCGHSPICQELRRLWRQGVVVCLAAGNEGHALLESARGRVEANMDISINDPANLEEAIAVGSVHKLNPHTYGVSYFSSRGPTADGRVKPDVVAPGERILSASHRFRSGEPRSAADLYVEMSGTSMAAPHVSGILAAFLSLRREFLGNPDRVKEILLEACTDLRRDTYIQGRGLPNLMKMLSAT